MAKIIINQDKIDNIEEVLQICPFEAMEEVEVVEADKTALKIALDLANVITDEDCSY